MPKISKTLAEWTATETLGEFIDEKGRKTVVDMTRRGLTRITIKKASKRFLVSPSTIPLPLE